MGREKINERWTYDWRTVSVTALPPGWVNVFREDDGTEFTEPCPALLLQELVNETERWDEPVGDGTYHLRSVDYPAEEPRSTRAVYGSFDGAELEPATDADNYCGTEWRPEAAS
jgi:hypothetical protein